MHNEAKQQLPLQKGTKRIGNGLLIPQYSLLSLVSEQDAATKYRG